MTMPKAIAINPQFPIYIPSKGRWDSRLTVRALERMNVPYFVIVEKQEFKKYARFIDKGKLLVLPREYQENYDPCMELKPGESVGSGAARNFGWDHSIDNGHAWHWMVDDNITAFYRMNRNRRIKVSSGACFRAMEDFCLRYKNVAMAGPNYYTFGRRKVPHPPFIVNTRIFSCNLIRNDIPYRWRARYNEDLDLSIRVLKDGWCTILFYAFLQGKVATQTMKGGNTDEIYADGTYRKSKMIETLHPDIARVAWRFNRIHHYVNFRQFKENKLIYRDDYEPKDGINEYGMTLRKVR